MGDITAMSMEAAGVDPEIAASTGAAVGDAGAIGDQVMAGEDPANIDYSDLTSSTMAATADGVATVDPVTGAALNASAEQTGAMV